MSFPVAEAERVLDELRIASKDDLSLLEEIAWQRGALVRDALIEGAEARLVVVRRRGVITVSTAIQDPRRRRFSITHELGHFEMHFIQSILSFCVREDINERVFLPYEVNYEKEANIFASALLLPERFFAHLCQEEPSLDHISQLSDDFNVSLTATALRYLSFCNEPLALVFSQNNHTKWVRGSKDFEEVRNDLGFFIDVKSRLDEKSQAGRFFTGRPNSPKMKRTNASVWFTPGQYHPDATIQEQSFPMPNYNAVLTLLWVDDDIEKDEYDGLWS